MTDEPEILGPNDPGGPREPEGDKVRVWMTRIGQKKGERSRASKYSEDHGPAIILMAEEGCWPEEWLAFLGVTERTIYNWCLQYPEFREDLWHARHVLAAFWARKARSMIGHPNTTLLWNTLKTRLARYWSAREAPIWADMGISQEQVQGDGSGETIEERINGMSDEELEEEMERLRQRDEAMRRARAAAG